MATETGATRPTGATPPASPSGGPKAGPRPVRAPRGPERSCRGWAQEAALRRIREAAPGPGPDRFLAPELEAVERLVGDGAVLAAVEAAVGELR